MTIKDFIEWFVANPHATDEQIEYQLNQMTVGDYKRLSQVANVMGYAMNTDATPGKAAPSQRPPMPQRG